jgi:phage virion morphogenesis protein
MVAVQFEPDDQALEAALKRLEAATSNYQPLFNDIGESALGFIQGYFDQERAPDGSEWDELDPDYLEYKKRKGFLLDILKQRGVLFRNIAYQTTANSLVIGSNLIYAAVQNEKRDFINLGEDRAAVSEFRDLVADHIQLAWGG